MIAQVVFLCIASLAAARPYVVPSYGGPANEPIYEAKPKPYSFGFDTKDEYGTILSRREEGDELGNKRGSYGFVDSYGLSRQVDYIADDKGFRAIVKTNEPGTKNENPADVEILSDAAPVNYDAPAVYGKAPLAAAYSRPAIAFKSRPLSPVAPLSSTYTNPGASVYTPASAAYGQAPAAYGQAPAAYGQAPAAYGQAPAAYGQAPAAYGQAPAAYGQPQAVYGQPQAVYGQPQAVYSQPQAVYGQPQATYGQPQAVYDQAPAAYGPAPSAYSQSPVYDQLSPQAYEGPSYEQLSNRASQPTDSRADY